MQAWVSCSGGELPVIHPHALGGAQCGEQLGPDLQGIDGKGMIPKRGWGMKKSNVRAVSLCSARSCVNVQRD